MSYPHFHIFVDNSFKNPLIQADILEYKCAKLENRFFYKYFKNLQKLDKIENQIISWNLYLFWWILIHGCFSRFRQEMTWLFVADKIKFVQSSCWRDIEKIFVEFVVEIFFVGKRNNDAIKLNTFGFCWGGD